MIKIAIFASGSGSNAEKIAEYFANNKEIGISTILTNNPAAGVIDRAKKLNIDCIVFDNEAFKNGKVLEILINKHIDFVLLAGFLRLIPASFIEAFPNKIINLHPALLPKYGGKGMYGHHVHEAVIDNREKESGITIHYVNAAYDEGAIIFQAKYPIAEHDSALDIAIKGQILEHNHFAEVIESVVLGKIK
jgi:phosphoribosylglycinamide formyltransferase 1